MYHKDFTMCRFYEKWVESNLATYCEQYVQDGEVMEYLMSDDIYQSITEILKTVLTSNYMMIGTAIAFIACFIASFI